MPLVTSAVARGIFQRIAIHLKTKEKAKAEKAKKAKDSHAEQASNQKVSAAKVSKTKGNAKAKEIMTAAAD